MRKYMAILLAFGVLIAQTGCAKASAEARAADTTEAENNAKVVFIELGSVNCIPCKAMQPIMDEISEKYGDQVEVRFHDVWTAEGQPFGRTYGIRVIPTQVFLGKDGKEYFRHEGYFPLEELLKVLETGGVSL